MATICNFTVYSFDGLEKPAIRHAKRTLIVPKCVRIVPNRVQIVPKRLQILPIFHENWGVTILTVLG